MTEAVRKDRADAYRKSIDELVESGLELCQAKLIMDLREKDAVKVGELAGKYISSGEDPTQAHSKASKLFEKADKKRLDIIRKDGIYSMSGYARALRGAELHGSREPDITDAETEDATEAIVVEDEEPNEGAVVEDEEVASDEVSERGGIRNALRRAKAALVSGAGRLMGGTKRETDADSEGMSKGKKIALGIFAVGVAVGAGYAIYKGINGGGGGGNSEMKREAAERALAVGGRNSHRAAEAQQALIDAMSPEQQSRFSEMMNWQMDFMTKNGMDINDPKSWEKAAKMFNKGMTYVSTRGQGGSLPMTS